MNITTICNDRKTMAHALAEHLGTTAVYLRAPTYAFRIGSLQVERDGSITGERTDLEAVADWLMENGYIQEPIPAEETADAEQPAEEQAAEEQPEPDTDTDSEAPDGHGITVNCIGLPLAEFTPDSLKNMIRILYARQILIRAMVQSDRIHIAPEVIAALQSDALTEMPILEHALQENITGGFMKGIGLEDGRLLVEFPFDEEHPTRWQHYANLLLAIAAKAKAAKRVNTAPVEPADSEMKYFCRAFLLQLGLGGAEHKDTRSLLLNHLHGYAAFRTTEKMDAHRQKYADLRRQLRESDSEAQSEVPEHEKA